MKYPYFFLLVSLLFFNFQSSENEPHSPRIANYDMQIKLDTENKHLISHTKMLWKNPSADTIRDLQFHLYYNAFKNTESTFFKERGMPSLFKKSLEEEENIMPWFISYRNCKTKAVEYFYYY